jgi:hypothetical protein
MDAGFVGERQAVFLADQGLLVSMLLLAGGSDFRPRSKLPLSRGYSVTGLRRYLLFCGCRAAN